jgi:hypothetical protein
MSVTVRIYAQKHANPVQRIEVDANACGTTRTARDARECRGKTPVTLAIEEGLAMTSTDE